MTHKTDHISIHLPKYETQPVEFDTPTAGASVDIASIQNYIREKAEAKLEQCKSFEVSLPTSITGITSEANKIEFQSLFQTPTLNELEIVSTNPDGSSIKLNETQLRAVERTGEFEVDSIHFPGQRHRWKLSRILQSGIEKANEKFFKELSWALSMLIIFARDRIFADGFSLKATVRSWKQGFASLLDALIGLPAIYSYGIDVQVEQERSKFLVTELLPHESEKAMHEAFCAQVPLLLEMMAEETKYTRRTNQPIPPRMLPYPHHFSTPNNIDIDLRLHNRDLQTRLKTIISNLLTANTPKNWFHMTKRRLISKYKHEQNEFNLTKEEIAQRVQKQLNAEYAERAFQTIENSFEIDQLSPGLAKLLVAHARSIIVMKSVVDKLAEDLNKHLKQTEENLLREHPIKSKIYRWIERQLFEERVNYIQQHQWDAHQQSIEQCKTLGNQQAAYFIQRDLTFRKDHESVLRLNLKSSTEALRSIDCARSIWLPKNWIVERTYPLPRERIPTQFAKRSYSSAEEETRTRLIHSDPDATYNLRKKVIYSTSTKHPFWRWRLFTLRTYVWLVNTIHMLCLVIPFASPVSFRAAFSPQPFTPDYELNEKDLKLHQAPHSKTQTFPSRLRALWGHVRHSRQKFEQTPDRGFLGKNMQRLFNQFWNYIAKGFIGTVVICVVYPASCLLLSTVSFIVGVLSPIWMPIASLILHILQILFYDANSAGEYGRKFFCLINIILTDFFLCGLIQPILVLIALIVSPIISLLIVIYALLHRCTCGLYDKIIFHLVVKRFARIPAHNGFLARRTAGPGLAAEYFYQVSSPEVLAALESLIEQNELEVYRSYVERLLMSPIDEYRRFFKEAFEPFSASVDIKSSHSVFSRMNDVVKGHIQDLKKVVDKRHDLLRVQHGPKHDRIRLTESDLTAVLIEGTQLVEKWYPKRILPYLDKDQIESLWNDRELEHNDWFGLTSQLLQNLFCRDFLTPLEQTDAFYSLKVDHLTLSKYAHMINSANLHDDLDVVTSVYLPETSYTIEHPSFDQEILNPNERILEISTNYSRKYRSKNHGRLYRYLNRKANYTTQANKLSEYVDYTSITCRFSIPIRLPDVICVNIIIYNRDNNNSITTATTAAIKDVSSERIRELIDYNAKFYTEPALPTYSNMIASTGTIHNMVTDDETLVVDHANMDDDEPLTNNIVVLDEKLL